jgi:hypothetical protein
VRVHIRCSAGTPLRGSPVRGLSRGSIPGYTLRRSPTAEDVSLTWPMRMIDAPPTTHSAADRPSPAATAVREGTLQVLNQWPARGGFALRLVPGGVWTTVQMWPQSTHRQYCTNGVESVA